MSAEIVIQELLNVASNSRAQQNGLGLTGAEHINMMNLAQGAIQEVVGLRAIIAQLEAKVSQEQAE